MYYLRGFFMHWILQDNLFNENAYQVLLDTIKQFGLSHSVHKVVPFVGELHPDIGLDTNNVICMGSYSLRHIARQRQWNPGVFDLEPFNFHVQLEHWDNNMLNSDATVSKFKDVVFKSERHFVRPIEDSKIFSGAIFHQEDFEDWQHKVCELNEHYGNTVSSESLVQTCALKNIYSEHRFWIVRGKIVTASTYKQGRSVIYSELPSSSFVFPYVEEMIKVWQPHDAFVMDIADTEDGLKIIEINTLNSSGFYAANIQKLVMSLEDNFSYSPSYPGLSI